MYIHKFKKKRVAQSYVTRLRSGGFTSQCIQNLERKQGVGVVPEHPQSIAEVPLSNVANQMFT